MTVATATPATQDAAQLQRLADQHLPILRQAARKTGFRYRMPEGGPEAIDASLVVEADPTWMYSDDIRASNAFRLTELGRQVAHHLGWTCQCFGCRETSSRMGHDHGAVAIDGFCSKCQSSISKYGLSDLREQPCCRYHRVSMERDGAAEPFRTDDETLANLTQDRVETITMISNQTEFGQDTVEMQQSIKTDFVNMRSTSMAGPDQKPRRPNLTKEGQKATDRMDATVKKRNSAPRWKWYKHANLGWVAATEADQIPAADEPKAGDVITVMRKHGSASRHTIAGVRHTDHRVNPPMIIAILEIDQDTGAILTVVEAETPLDPEPVRYVKPNQRPEKSWVTPTRTSQPIGWHWRRRANQWVATGSRPLRQDEEPLQPGQIITVQRRDRSSSRQRVLSYCGTTCDGFPQLTVTPA